MKNIFTWKSTMILLVVSLITGAIVNGPVWGTGNLQKLMPGVTIPDLKFGYAPHELPGFFQAMGTTGREAYLTINNLDFLFIFSYLFFGYIAFGTLLRYLMSNKTLATNFALLGVLPGLCDLVETIIFRIIVSKPYDTHETLSHIASFMTISKFIAINAALVILIILSLAAAYKKFKSPSIIKH